MLTEDNKKDFAEILRATAEVYSKQPPSPIAMRMFFSSLQKYDMAQIEMAFTMHIKTSKFMPTVADIIDYIESTNPAMKRLGPEEAWAAVPKSEDESGVMTDEMIAAWSVAKDFIHSGDMIAARMAFKEAYARECETAKMMGKPVHWFLSRGHDGRDVESVVKEAMRLGRLPDKTGNALLLECGHKAPINSQFLLESAERNTKAERLSIEAFEKLKAAIQGKSVSP